MKLAVHILCIESGASTIFKLSPFQVLMELNIQNYEVQNRSYHVLYKLSWYCDKY